MIRTALATFPAKLAAAAAGLTIATAGLGAASALPGPIQQVASEVGDVIGVDLPAADGSTPTTEVTTPTTEVTTPTTGVTTPTTGVTTPTTGEVTTPTTVGAGTPVAVLPPAATTAAQAAKIHDFDEACVNHGAYVSFVARSGTEPACAAAARTGSTTPAAVTDPKGRAERPEADSSARQGESDPTTDAASSNSSGSRGPKRGR